MKPCLPQNDPGAAERKTQLDAVRALYEYDTRFLPPVPLLQGLPAPEDFNERYQTEKAVANKAYFDNEAIWQKRRGSEPFDDLVDYEYLFQTLPKPPVMATWRTDRAFAEQRLSGANPMKIRRVTEAGQVPFDARGSFTAQGTTIDAAVKEGRLYVADYTDLSFIEGGAYGDGKKYLPKPQALFYWKPSAHSTQGHLLPLAIQVDRGGRVYTPANEGGPLDWLLAKLCVQVADANHHEMVAHLCYTHFVMEPIATATARQLAASHPLKILLRPHFRFLIANNVAAMRLLINPGGFVDQLLGGSLSDSLKLATEAYRSWDFMQMAFPTELRNRGVDDVTALPHFPYRDDGKLLWDAIRSFVAEYLALYYRGPADLTQDFELTAWCEEMVDPGRASVKGFPTRFESVDALVDAVTSILFTCGPQHSAVNFAQYDYMGFVPNLPTAAYSLLPDGSAPVTEDFLLRFLPHLDRASEQLETAALLSAYRYDKLGYYDPGDFESAQALEVVQRFQKSLGEIEKTIDDRNRLRDVVYPFLKPSLVINSISV